MDCRVIQLDQYSRRENLIISGIPDNIKQQDLERAVIDIVKSIGLSTLSSYEITACHRLKKNKKDNFPAKTIVRFTNRKIVDFCLTHRDRLLEVKSYLKMNLRFFENLCTANEVILKECFHLKKDDMLYDYFIRNGYVKIIKKEGDKPYKICHPNILYDTFFD